MGKNKISFEKPLQPIACNDFKAIVFLNQTLFIMLKKSSSGITEICIKAH